MVKPLVLVAPAVLFLSAVGIAAAGAQHAPSAGSDAKPPPSDVRRDLAPDGSRNYGIEIRTDAGAECRLAPADAATIVRSCPWDRPTAFSVTWTRREVRLTVGRTTVRRPGIWLIGNAIHLSAAGGARLTVSRVKDRWAETIVAGDPSSGVPVDVWIADAGLASGWTISGTIERRTPTGSDALHLTVGNDIALPFESTTKPTMVSGGIAGPYAAPPSGAVATPSPRSPTVIPQAARTLIWTGAANGSWSNASNWDPAGPPASGDSLVFGGSGQPRQMVNDIASLVANSVTVSSDGYSLNGRLSATSLIKTGLGVFAYSGDGSGVSSTEISGGRLVLDGSLGNVLINGGTFVMRKGARAATISGSGGQLGSEVFEGGVISAGDGSNKAFRLSGVTQVAVPICHDDVQVMRVAGGVDMPGAQFSISFCPGYLPSPGKKFLVIDNDGSDPVNGRSQGTHVLSGNADVTFDVDYKGGEGGNDVVFTVTGVTAIVPPDLSIVKSHTPDRFMEGGQGTYTLSVTNTGQGSTILPITVTDTLPAGLTPNSFSGGGWTCGFLGQTATCTYAALLQPGQSTTVAIVVGVSASAGSVVNSATVSGGGTSTPHTTTDTTAIDPVAPAPDLRIAKTHAPSKFIQGGQGTYTLTISNVAQGSTVGAIIVSDTLPNGLTPVSVSAGTGWNCPIEGQRVRCTYGAVLAPSVSAIVTITVDVSSSATGSVTNTAALSGGGDPTPPPDASDTTTIEAPLLGPDLSLTKTHEPERFLPGGAGTFTLTIANIGQQPSVGAITLVDTLPAGLTFAAAAGDGWNCSNQGQSVTCTHATPVAPSSSSSVTVRVNVATTASGTLTNTAIVSGGGDTTPETANNAVTIEIPPSANEPDLRIAKTHAPSKFIQGGQGTYTLTVSNVAQGPTVGAIIVSDTLPNGLTPVSVSAGTGWNCPIEGQRVRCTYGAVLAPSVSAIVTITVDVSSSATGSVTNTAALSGGGDPTPPPDATDTTTIEAPLPGPDLSLTKTHEPERFLQGDAGTFTLTIANIGQQPSVGAITLVDTLPAGLTFASAAGDGWNCSNQGQTVTCTHATPVAPSSSSSVTVRVNVATTASGTLTNTAIVSGGGDTTPETANNSVTIEIPPSANEPDLRISKTHAPATFTKGGEGAYTLTITNQGSGPTTAAINLTDALPPGLTPISASGSGWTCAPLGGQVVTCGYAATLPAAPTAGPSNTATLTITVAVADAAPGSVTNTATVGGGGDSTPSTTTDVTPIDQSVAPGPDLHVTKHHTPSTLTQGGQGAYTLTVVNQGSGATTGSINVSDSLPTGLTPVLAAGAGWSCAPIQGQLVTCTYAGVLSPDGSATLTITVNVSEQAAIGTITNLATVSGGGDQTAATATDPTPIQARPLPQLTISKSHPDPVVQGQQGLSFDIRISNTGGPTSGEITVTDSLPSGLTPVDATGTLWTCGIGGQTVTCRRTEPLTREQPASEIHLTVDVAADAVSTANTADVSGGADPASHTATDRIAISPAGTPNLFLIKEHDGDFVQGQTGAIYRVRVDNRGQKASSGSVVVTDSLPSSVLPTSASGTGWTCSVAAQRVTCERSDSLVPGTSWPAIQIAVNVSATASSIVNTATLSGGGDVTPGDNLSDDRTIITAAAPDLRVSKRHQDPFLPGQTGAAYDITIANVGAIATSGEVTVTDSVPAGMTPTAASGSGWQCTTSGQAVTCRRGDALAPGQRYSDITLRVNVSPTASSVANIVSVSGGGDTTPDNSTATDFTNVAVSVDAAISLSLGSELVLGGPAEYLAQVISLGPGTIGGDTVVTTEFSEAQIPVAAEGPGWRCRRDAQRFICSQPGAFEPGTRLPDLRLRVLVGAISSEVTTTSVVNAPGDSNAANDRASVASSTRVPQVGLRIEKKASTDRAAIGGSVIYRVEIANVGDARVTDTVIRDLLPRGFQYLESATDVQSTRRSPRQLRAGVAGDQDQLEWNIGTVAPGEMVNVIYRVVVGAAARVGRQDNRANVQAADPTGDAVTAGPAIATVEVTQDGFSLLQALIGRVYEDQDRNGIFTNADRPIANARVITSTGQAAVTDADGLYNIPSLGAGSVVASLDRSTVPGHLTIEDGGPGERSWTRLLRTPVGGGTVLRQNFALVPAAGQTAGVPAAVTLAAAAPPAGGPADTTASNASGALPPRREYQSREGQSVFIGLGEISFGKSAPEFEVFKKDGDMWGYGSVFIQTPVGTPKNRLTLAYDTHRNLSGTTAQNRLFELDPNDRLYPVFGDSSRRQEFATSNAKLFGRLERGPSYVMYGDLIGDLPSSDRDGGRWSAYQRHLTGAEVHLANTQGDGVSVRGAQPASAYARDVFSGSLLGQLGLTHGHVLAGTETVAVEIRDRRVPERVLSRDVLQRSVDYELETVSGAIFLRRHVGGLDAALNLVQLVATYEYERPGLDNMVYSGRGAWTYRGLRVGGAFFTEEGIDGRFNVTGVDLEQRLPRGGRFRMDLPYSHGTPNVPTSIDRQTVNQRTEADGAGLQATIEQPVSFWNGRLSGSFVGADRRFQNPFSSTITPGARYASAAAELSPRTPSRLQAGVADEDYTTNLVDAHRTTVSGSWSETIAKRVTLTGGYDARWLDRHGRDTDSGLVTAAARVTIGDRFEARAAREQNVRDDTDPTYPDQTTLGARYKIGKDASLFYTQRISDDPIVPIGDFTGTGFSALPTTSELTLGVESRVADATRLTSRYEIEQGINGPDAFATIGVLSQIGMRHGFAGTFGADHGKLVSGVGSDYTSGTLGLAYLGSDRFKASARYEARERDGYSGLLTTGLAARVVGGLTGLFRAEWLDSGEDLGEGHSLSFLTAIAIRPTTNERAGLLLSHQYVDRDLPVQAFGQPREAPGWRQRWSTDGYVQPLRPLVLHGKVAWQQTNDPGRFVGTYLVQARAQVTLHRYVDAAFEERYIRQQFTDTSRRSSGLEIGIWPVADLRAAAGYSFHNSRDPLARDLEGRARGFYVVVSTKLSRLFNLMGTPPRAAAGSASKAGSRD